MLSSSDFCLAFAALILVESDGETMHLVLYLREEFEHETLYRHADRFGREAEQEFRSPVFPVFCQPGYRNVQVQFVLDHFAYDFHLPLSTVGDDQVGQGESLRRWHAGSGDVRPLSWRHSRPGRQPF